MPQLGDARVMSQADRWDQVHAETIVAKQTGGKSSSRDVPGAPPGTHDFDVQLPDGRLLAVEVTRHTAQAGVQRDAEIHRQDWNFSGLRHWWALSVGPGVPVQVLHGELPDLLGALEASGIEGARLHTDEDIGAAPGSEAKEALGRLRQHGVHHLTLLTPNREGGGGVTIGSAPVIGSTHPDTVVDAVEKHARRKEKTLLPAVADERHLFLWIEAYQHSALAAMAMGEFPRPPLLPDAIDAVWVVGGANTGEGVALQQGCGLDR